MLGVGGGTGSQSHTRVMPVEDQQTTGDHTRWVSRLERDNPGLDAIALPDTLIRRSGAVAWGTAWERGYSRRAWRGAMGRMAAMAAMAGLAPLDRRAMACSRAPLAPGWLACLQGLSFLGSLGHD